MLPLMCRVTRRGGSLNANKICAYSACLLLAAISRSDTPILAQSKCRTIAEKKRKCMSVTARLTSTQIRLPRRSEPGKRRRTYRFPRALPSDAVLLLSLTAACCVCFFFCFALTDCAAVMTSKSAGLSVRCTSPRVRLPGGACIVSGEKKKKKGITRRLYLQSNFIPPATRGGLSSEPCLAFKCGKSAQSPPLTRNAARLSSWCSLNKLNNEGISEMPKRHYTPTIRARSE